MAVRNATFAALAVAAAVLGTFWIALHPVAVDGCHTSLAPSAFKDALIPVHLAAAAVLSACLLALSTGRRTLAGLAVAWAYVLASLAHHGLFGVLGIVAYVAAPTVGLLGVVALLVRTVSAVRAGAGWGEQAFSVQVLLWGALVIGLPANLAYAWSAGADLFCV